ncbi:rha family phage regulatory protein [Lachnospiraceae bacterium M18-1]|nr:rha family phage regulatory protein [Lachnospiraceae bacterium M18-1]
MLVEMKKLNKREVNVVSSLDVAETFEKEHKNVLADVRNIQSEVSSAEFSALFYEGEYKASNGKKNPMYYMNRDGFTILAMGYTGEKAMRFKLAYISQFNQMESMLQGRLIEREKGIVVRQAFTRAIKELEANGRMHGHAYSIYTNVIYKSIFGKDAKRLREEYGIGRQDNIRECFNEEELKQVQNAEMLVGSLIGYGWDYARIKDFILDKSLARISDANEEMQ